VTDAPDQLFRDPLRAPGPFRFDADVVQVFPDMIRRSVPGYETVIAMTGLIGARHAVAGSRVYDLGCSLGASTVSLCRHIDSAATEVIGVDSSAAMIERCREILATAGVEDRVRLLEQDIIDTPIEDASVVVLNYTLQFIPLEERADLLRRIAAGMREGGVLVLSEKVLFADATLNALNIELHHDFKRAHGYSDLEIAGKRDSLENVLVPETVQAHRERLLAAGFRSCDVWFQCFNFASLVALR
jgi:tRNA (cmo5U34)-methyltransferase